MRRFASPLPTRLAGEAHGADHRQTTRCRQSLDEQAFAAAMAVRWQLTIRTFASALSLDGSRVGEPRCEARDTSS